MPDIDTFQHIISGHMNGGHRLLRPNGTPRSFFNPGEDWIKLGIETWEKGIFTEVGVKEYDFNRIIGITQEGLPTSVVKVVTGGARWVTSYPIDKMTGV